MRRILVDKRSTEEQLERVATASRVDLDDHVDGGPLAAKELLALNDALDKLAERTR